MADATERTSHGFTREQIEFLRETIGRPSAQGFDRSTLMAMFGGLVAVGLIVSGALWTEIGSVRDELRSEFRTEIASVREEIRENRAAITELAKGQARIEAILEERLPRAR
ncbi:MAG: hypothetical protein F4145_17420 [Boseongicola sp. SB0675_bin_26]|nr:hypothetical protein [Acidobacteriota bacterium]MYE10485.1 hypothetical protein [Gammaproteobacteria bacterium]MYH59714.1 hypothetical protein [Boseongicola sp. SB0675_bin_26]